MKYNRHRRTLLGHLGSAKPKHEKQSGLPGFAYNPHVLADTTKHENGMMPTPTGRRGLCCRHFYIKGIMGYYLLVLCFVCGIFAPAWASENMSTYSAEDCMACHTSNAGDSSLQISLENFQSSVHGRTITCLGCHTDITDDAHMEEGMVKPVDCSRCHGIKTRKTGMFESFSTFRISSHAKADFAGNYKMENCLGCHQGTGAHGESSPINDQDCFKCHDPARKNALWGKMHPDQRNRALPVVFLYICVAFFFLVALMRQVTPVLDRAISKINNKGKR